MLRRMNTQRGITLLELMMAVAVGAILVGIGVPSFVNTIRNSEMTSATNGLVGALYAARSEAVKRRARVTICFAKEGSTRPNCDIGGDRLLVFENTANDLSLDTGDTVIKSVPWLSENIQASVTGVNAGFSFNASGFTRDAGGNTVNGSVLFCDPRGDDLARIVTIAPTGRPTVRARNDVTGAPSCP